MIRRLVRPGLVASIAPLAPIVSFGVLALFASSPRAAAQQLLMEAHGGTSGGDFGATIVALGDVNGDGCDEFAIGERFHDNGALTAAGRVVVIDGATGATLRTHDGAAAGDELGTSIAVVGDWSGDGVADYIVGIPGRDVSSKANAGRFQCFSGVSGTLLRTFDGNTASGRLGDALCSVPDADGDGYDDVLAGLPAIGEARVYAKSGSIVTTISGSTASEFATRVARIGDTTGDGVDDFAISEQGYDSVVPFKVNRGRLQLFSGATRAFYVSLLGTNAGDRFGASIARLRDVNGDRIDELAVGSTDFDGSGLTDNGELKVFDGATRATLFTIDGAASYHRTGASACGLRDWNHDGIDDFAVGSTGGGAVNRGLVEVRSGVDASLLSSFEGASSSAGWNNALGSSLAGGDWNGDGIGDLAAGDPDWFQAWPSATLGYVGAWLGCPAFSKSYGSGLAGKLGVPSLTCVTPPVLGTTFDTYVTNSAGHATTALLFVGAAKAAIPYKGGTILATSDFLALSFTIGTSGETFSEDVPNDPALAFVDLYAQVLEADSLAPRGVSFTRGLQIRLGY